MTESTRPIPAARGGRMGPATALKALAGAGTTDPFATLTGNPSSPSSSTVEPLAADTEHEDETVTPAESDIDEMEGDEEETEEDEEFEDQEDEDFITKTSSEEDAAAALAIANAGKPSLVASPFSEPAVAATAEPPMAKPAAVASHDLSEIVRTTMEAAKSSLRPMIDGVHAKIQEVVEKLDGTRSTVDEIHARTSAPVASPVDERTLANAINPLLMALEGRNTARHDTLVNHVNGLSSTVAGFGRKLDTLQPTVVVKEPTMSPVVANAAKEPAPDHHAPKAPSEKDFDTIKVEKPKKKEDHTIWIVAAIMMVLCALVYFLWDQSASSNRSTSPQVPAAAPSAEPIAPQASSDAATPASTSSTASTSNAAPVSSSSTSCTSSLNPSRLPYSRDERIRRNCGHDVSCSSYVNWSRRQVSEGGNTFYNLSDVISDGRCHL